MKCFVLGLDGIEYDFVEAWNLKSLMQAKYGKIEVPIGERGVPMSPQVWASFLTGKVENVSFPEKPRSYKSLKFIWDNFGFFVKPFSSIKQVCKRVGDRTLALRGQLNFDQELKNPTFLDTNNFKAIDVPFINHDNSTFKIGYRLLIGKSSVEETLESLRQDYVAHKQSMLRELKENEEVDLVFAYLKHADDFQHYAHTQQEIVEEIYDDVNDFVASLTEELTALYPDSYFIIVSDHGFNLNTGMHSMHAFYSTNTPLDPPPKKITDFYSILTSIANKK